jgi:transposase
MSVKGGRESVVLAEDETDLLLFPPLRAGWSRRGEPVEVRLSGRNARRVVFGAMDLVTGERWFLARERQRSADFQAFLDVLDQAHGDQSVILLLDADPSHTSKGTATVLAQKGMTVLWLPKRAPELNPMDTLWGQAKDRISANTQYATIEEQGDRFIEHLESLSNAEALRSSGVLSDTFWLHAVLSNYFCGDA